MIKKYDEVCQTLTLRPKRWLITGVAGFIGSNILEKLLNLNQKVVGLDNFSTGHNSNLEEVRDLVTSEQWSKFKMVKGDIANLICCQQVCKDIDYVLHQAALGSVPRSIKEPIATNISNVDGFLNMLVASRDNKVDKFVFAASSSTYGDHPSLPKVEDKIGSPLSPYAVTKLVNELYADVFSKSYNLDFVGLRYFNIFGQRQDPEGAYAAVIPKWIEALSRGDSITINGDGETSRDFCYIDNAVQANILSACCTNVLAKNQIYNIAVGERTTLNDLHQIISNALNTNSVVYFRDFRSGDVKHSLANIDKAQSLLGYRPTHNVYQGLEKTVSWHLSRR